MTDTKTMPRQPTLRDLQRRLDAFDAMREAMRKAADELDGIIAVRAVSDAVQRIASDLRAAAEC